MSQRRRPLMSRGSHHASTSRPCARQKYRHRDISATSCCPRSSHASSALAHARSPTLDLPKTARRTTAAPIPRRPQNRPTASGESAQAILAPAETPAKRARTCATRTGCSRRTRLAAVRRSTPTSPENKISGNNIGHHTSSPKKKTLTAGPPHHYGRTDRSRCLHECREDNRSSSTHTGAPTAALTGRVLPITMMAPAMRFEPRTGGS
jgi:hypothetical protein